MTPRVAFAWLLVINALIAVGDYFAKRAVESPERSSQLTLGALVLWSCACCLWLPVMRARGFTRLVALADVIGLLMLAVIGYVFLGERLSLREGIGVALALTSIGFLA